MNLSKPLNALSHLTHFLFLECRMRLPRQRCNTFVSSSGEGRSGIGSIYVINLDRQPKRWANMLRELDRIEDGTGNLLSERVIRHSAYDAQAQLPEGRYIKPFYTLGDQLFVEPQPEAMPDKFELERSIKMSTTEVAIARSHIDVWKVIAQSSEAYSLVVEDDVWFKRSFARTLDLAWQEMGEAGRTPAAFDLLYLSYKEARYGAPKELISKNVFRPEGGLWFLSGYVLSKTGAQGLLRHLPCRGPIDLWLNHKFQELCVRAVRQAIINQRSDTPSTNSYSILPALSRIGVLNSDNNALFQQRPAHTPVFAFGSPGPISSSLAMALSMLGYRCCSGLEQIPEYEYDRLIAGSSNCIFNAYVNVASLSSNVRTLLKRYPSAKFIIVDSLHEAHSRGESEMLEALEGADFVHLHGDDATTWRAICEHLRVAPPVAPYPNLNYSEQKQSKCDMNDTAKIRPAKRLRYDCSPWVVEPRAGWAGISTDTSERSELSASHESFEDALSEVQANRWLLRNDTFPGNLGLFRPANVTVRSAGGLSLKVDKEPLGVRNLSAAAISSRDRFLYGYFEATFQATNTPGLVTGFFLHRDSPRQEIDVEITGNRPDRLLVNVFYNPGGEGAKFDYGYRGTPAVISLGFDASIAPHRFAIEWEPSEIRWFVDGELVHRRVCWNPTPIPHLPMTVHVNTWPTRSRKLAGRLLKSALPVSATLCNIAIDAVNSGIVCADKNTL